MYAHWVHSRYPRRPEEGAGCPGTGVPGLCKPPQMCWAQTWVLRKSKCFNHWAISPTLIFNCYHPDPVTGISTSFLSTGQLIILLRGNQYLGFTFENFPWVSERPPSLYEHDADTWVVLCQYVTKFWSRQYTEGEKKSDRTTWMKSNFQKVIIPQPLLTGLLGVCAKSSQLQMHLPRHARIHILRVCKSLVDYLHGGCYSELQYGWDAFITAFYAPIDHFGAPTYFCEMKVKRKAREGSRKKCIVQ